MEPGTIVSGQIHKTKWDRQVTIIKINDQNCTVLFRNQRDSDRENAHTVSRQGN
jgi:hypothetical protein